MKKLLPFLFVLSSILSFGQQHEAFYIVDPQGWGWNANSGTFDSIQVDVKPFGNLVEVKTTLKVSQQSLSGDSLEAQIYFLLDPKYEITDLELWIGDSIAKAGIYDKWTAIQVYEDIVDRRTDPALLYKYREGNYALFIFPIGINMPRKFSFTYIQESEQNIHGLTVGMPSDLFKLANTKPVYAEVNFLGGADYHSPQLTNLNSNWVQKTNSSWGTYQSCNFNANTFKSNFSLNYEKQVSRPYSVEIFQQSNSLKTNFLHFSFSPKDLFQLENKKKILFVVDYVNGNSQRSFNEVVDNLNTTLLQYLNPSDSINFCYSLSGTSFWKPSFQSATAANIADAINFGKGKPKDNNSNLAFALTDIAFYLNDNNLNDISIIFISNDLSNGSQTKANTLINNFNSIFPINQTTFHMINLNTYGNWVNVGGIAYYGNEYLWNLFANISFGTYQSYQQSGWEVYEKALVYSGDYFSNFKVKLDVSNGVIFDEFKTSENFGFQYVDQEYRGVFEYIGYLPLEVEVHGLINGQAYVTKKLNITDTNSIKSDSIVHKVFVGQKLKDIIKSQPSNLQINSAIQLSLKTRVLCDYTAFLALEQGVQVPPDPNGNNGGGLTSTEEQKSLESFENGIYPNPNNGDFYIRFSLEKSQKIEILIFDIYGKLIHQEFSVYPQGEQTLPYTLQDLPEGTYILRVKGEREIIISQKVVISK